MFRILKVSGDSLVPHLEDGDFVLTSKIPIWFKHLKQGDLIAFENRDYGVMVKMLDHTTHNGSGFFLLGTAPTSIDSRVLGIIPKEAVIGKVVARFRA